jgi:hypothetical protein
MDGHNAKVCKGATQQRSLFQALACCLSKHCSSVDATICRLRTTGGLTQRNKPTRQQDAFSKRSKLYDSALYNCDRQREKRGETRDIQWGPRIIIPLAS